MSPQRRPRKNRSSQAALAGPLLLALLVGAYFLYQLLASGEEPRPVAYTPPPGATPLGASLPDWYSLYFTRPESSISSFRGGPDAHLATAIEQAVLSVDLAAMEFNLFSLRDALISTHRRGVPVRVVTDSDYLDEPEVQDLIDAGIPVIGDRRESLMHNKFVVIDRQEVWTGSMNMTVNGAYRNNNNLIRIRSSRLAQNYATEFEEMAGEDLFGRGSPANTPHPRLKVNGVDLENYFSPDDGVQKRLLELINEAETSIHFLAFSFTSDDLAAAIIARSREGVEVRGVMEAAQVRSNEGTEFENFQAAGLDVRLDGNPRSMHHKVIIIDGRTVVTGSYNFSYNAENNNDENVLIIHSPEIAAAFLDEFEVIFAEAQ